MAFRIKGEDFFETPKTQTKVIRTQSKRKVKLENEEPLDETPKGVDWKLVRTVQRYQKE